MQGKGDAEMDQSKTGRFIMERRKRKGLTQAQLAERLGITDRAVSKWETGRSLPDSSIMLELCGLLEITADELLRGGQAPPWTEAAALPLPEETEPPPLRRSRRRWWCAVLFTGGLLAGVLTCFICDMALSGRLTWSLIPAISAEYGWAVLFPLIALRRRGPAGSLAAVSVFTVPYLYGLSRLLGVQEVFTVGAAMTALSVLFLWLAFAAFWRMGWTRAALGIVFLLLAGLTAAVNGTLSLMNAAPPTDAWNVLSVLLLLMAAAAAFTWKGGRERA